MTTLSKEVFRFCPYCRSRGGKDDALKQWECRSVTTGLATRWTRCESCNAMWREVYNRELHVFEYKEHWKPAS